MDAQEAAQSDKSRAKASREKRKDLVRRRRVTSRDGSVTNCDAPVTNCDETVTPRHTASLQTKLAQTNPSQPSCAPGSPEWIKSELDKRDELALVATEKFAERLLGAAISAGTVELIPKALDEAAEKLGAKDAVDAAPAKEHQASFVLGCVKRVKSGPPPGAMSHAAVKGTEPRLPWDDGPSRTQQICNLEDRERHSQLSAEQNAQAAREALAKLGGAP